MTISISCHSCAKSLQLPKDIGRREECEHCGADLHCCYHCKFYDKTSYNECKEVSADPVKEKDRANFCDYFELGSAGSVANEKANLLAAAEALFKK